MSSLQDTLEEIIRRLDKLEKRLDDLETPEYSSDIFTGFANPAASVVLAPVNGVATTAMRSDAAPQLSQAIAPTWTGLHTFQRSGLTASFHQNGVAGAAPVIQLEQADVDVVLMKIIGTASNAFTDRTLVADADFGTPGALVGWIQIEIQDDGNRITDGDYYWPFYAAPT